MMAFASSPVLYGIPDEAIVGHESDIMVSRTGGKPTWCQPRNNPCCYSCGADMTLVVQVYCPLEESPYHRVIYVFTCGSCACSGEHIWQVIRQQFLPESSSTVGHQPNTETSNSWVDESESAWGEPGGFDTTLLEQLGIKSDKTKTTTIESTHTNDLFDDLSDWNECSNNEGQISVMPSKTSGEKVDFDKENVCCESCGDTLERRVEDTEAAVKDEDLAKAGLPNEDTNASTVLAEDLPFNPQESVLAGLMSDKGTLCLPNPVQGKDENSFFDSYYINVFDECDFKEEELKHEKELLAKYYQQENSSSKIPQSKSSLKIVDDTLYEKTSVKHGDQAFYKFKKRLALCPEQILRYQVSGSPVYISSHLPTSVPVCQHCGSKRQFEFQLMPPLINLLQNGLDFGTVLLYSCDKSCWNSTDTSKEEFAFIQNAGS